MVVLEGTPIELAGLGQKVAKPPVVGAIVSVGGKPGKDIRVYLYVGKGIFAVGKTDARGRVLFEVDKPGRMFTIRPIPPAGHVIIEPEEGAIEVESTKADDWDWDKAPSFLILEAPPEPSILGTGITWTHVFLTVGILIAGSFVINWLRKGQ